MSTWSNKVNEQTLQKKKQAILSSGSEKDATITENATRGERMAEKKTEILSMIFSYQSANFNHSLSAYVTVSTMS